MSRRPAVPPALDADAEALLQRNLAVSRATAELQRGDLQAAQAVLEGTPAAGLHLADVFALFQADQESALAHLRENQARTEQSLAWFAHLFETLPMAALMLSEDGQILQANSQAVVQLQLKRAMQAMGVPLRRLMTRPDDEVALAQGLRAVLAGENGTRLDDLPLRTLEGQPLWADLQLCVLPTLPAPGNRPRALCLVNDTTARRQAEQARVDARLAEQARERAEAASQSKTRLLSRISHELRTPLNAVIGFSHLMALDAQALDPTSRQRLQMIEQAGQHLLALVNEVLEINAAESGQLRFTLAACSLREAVLAALPLHALALAEAGLQVQGPAEPPAGGEPEVWADERRLREVLNNLLSNAIKYNRAGGQVGLTLGHDLHHAWVRVSDQGRGLAPDQLAHLFEPFNRLGAERGNVPGHGLGLSIAHALARAMGGQLEAESVPGEGSTFTLRLQRA